MAVNQWFKFYGGEYLNDPKIAALSPQDRSCWITLLALASISSEPGKIEYLTVEALLQKSGIIWDPYNPDEWNAALTVLDKFARMKMIQKGEDGTIEICNWKKRQETSLTNAERQARFREKNQPKVTNVTEEVTRPVTKVTLDKRRIDKIRRENTNTPASQSEPELIVNLIDAFEPVNPSFKTWYKRTTQRGAADRLIQAHGLEKLLSVVALLQKTNGTPFFPTITSPAQLEDKWAALEVAMRRKKEEITNRKQVFI